MKKFLSTSVLGIIISLFVAVQTQSQIISPDNLYVSVKGNNNGSCSIENPCATLQHAFKLAKPSGTIYLRGVPFNKKMTKSDKYIIPNANTKSRFLIVNDGEGGTENNPITISNFPGERVILYGGSSGPRYAIEIKGNRLTQLETGHIRIQGIEMEYFKRSAIYIRSSVNVVVYECQARNTSLEDSSRAAFKMIGNCRNCRFERCIAQDGSIGFFLDETGGFTRLDKVPADGNPLGRSGWSRVNNWNTWRGYTGVAPTECSIIECIAFDNVKSAEHSDGIGMNYPTRCQIRNNISFRNGDDGIDGLGATSCIFMGNICFNQNPKKTDAGDGNGIKVGVRGGYKNVVIGNLCLFNPRAGIDVTISYNSIIISNTTYKNGSIGIYVGDKSSQMQRNPYRMVMFRNLSVNNGAGKSFAKNRAYNTSMFASNMNASNDSNEFGKNTIPLGPRSTIGFNPDLELSGTLNSIKINTKFVQSMSIGQKVDFIRTQVSEYTSLLTPKINSDLFGIGAL